MIGVMPLRPIQTVWRAAAISLFVSMLIVAPGSAQTLCTSQEALCRHLPGAYKLDDGTFLFIDFFDPAPHADEPLAFGLLHPATGIVRRLTLDSETVLVHGSTMLDSDASSGRLELQTTSDGRVNEIRWSVHGGSPRTGLPLNSTLRRSVWFTSCEGSPRLLGSLVEASTTETRSAIVMIHGSGPGGRFYLTYGLISRWLAHEGFTVLTYDKRGYGRSEGPAWQGATIPELACDAAGAVRYLAASPSVPSDKIGLWGHSQGGWISPVVALRERVAFQVLLAPPATDSWTQELDSIEQQMRAHGYAVADVRRGIAAMRRMFAVAETGADIDQLRPVVAAVAAEEWSRLVPVTADAAVLEEWRRTRFEPQSILRRTTTPTLLLFGARDLIVPPQTNVPLWTRYLAEAGNDRIRVRIFGDAGHGLLQTSGAAAHGTGGSFARGVLPTIMRWLQRPCEPASRLGSPVHDSKSSPLVCSP